MGLVVILIVVSFLAIVVSVAAYIDTYAEDRLVADLKSSLETLYPGCQISVAGGRLFDDSVAYWIETKKPRRMGIFPWFAKRTEIAQIFETTTGDFVAEIDDPLAEEPITRVVKDHGEDICIRIKS
jgi:hypothetical protein